MNYNYASKNTSLSGKAISLVKRFTRSIGIVSDKKNDGERKIFLCAGHNRSDSGAIEGDLVEANLTIELRNLISAKIKNFTVLTDDDNLNLSQTVSWIESLCKPNDIILDLHFNDSDSSKATGCETFVPMRYSDDEYNLAANLNMATSKILDIPNRGVKTEDQSPRKRLAMMRPDGINVLLEVSFLSNESDMEKYQERKIALADSIAGVLSEA